MTFLEGSTLDAFTALFEEGFLSKCLQITVNSSLFQKHIEFCKGFESISSDVLYLFGKFPYLIKPENQWRRSVFFTKLQFQPVTFRKYTDSSLIL